MGMRVGSRRGVRGIYGPNTGSEPGNSCDQGASNSEAHFI